MSSDRERFQRLKSVWLRSGSQEREAVVDQVWFHGETLILKFAGVDTISAAELLQGCDVCIPMAERRSLEPGEVFVSDLIGCEVFDGGQRLGTVSDFLDAGGPGLLELDNGMLIPFARSICVKIDPEGRRIEVDLPDGLKDLNES